MLIDAHLDLAYNVVRGRDIRQPAAHQPAVENEIATVGFPDLRAGDVGLVFSTIFCIPKSYRRHGYLNPQEAHEQALGQIAQYRTWHDEGHLCQLGFADAASFRSSVGDATKAYILLEGAAAIRSPADVQFFHEQGVRIVGLSWQRTQYAGGTSNPGPLTDAGKEIVRELDRVGMLHDASHLAEHSFWDLMHATDKLVIASHSNCRSIVKLDPGERHLTDAMIRAIAARGGVIGMNFYDKFLLPHDEYGKRRATFDDVAAHVKHICDLTGSADHVAIGTDMDGGLGRDQIPQEIVTAADLPKLGQHLRASGFSQGDVDKINGGNWQRVIERAL